MGKTSWILLGLALIVGRVHGQESYSEEMATYQESLNASFKDPETSPMPKKERRRFKGLNFYPVDEKYRIEARFERIYSPVTLQMPTTTGESRAFDKYGKAVFSLDGQEYELILYQSHRLRATEEYRDYLFLPFTDPTNGEGSYGAGRYIDLSIPEGDTITIDFNKAYNPSCAYGEGYSCPIPPEENRLTVPIKAGVRYE